jgi:hypothetical protein
MTPPAQGLRGLTRKLPPGPADLGRTGCQAASWITGNLLPSGVQAGLKATDQLMPDRRQAPRPFGQK